MITFKCPSCDDDIVDNGSYACGYCGRCSIFFHKFSRLFTGPDIGAREAWIPSPEELE